MNIFFLDREPVVAAVMHTDKHVVKMVLETSQILSAVQHRYFTGMKKIYKPTHTNHPSILWAGDSRPHYRWVSQLGLALTAEYTYRYGKTHACAEMLQRLATHFPVGMPDNGWTDPPQCMPDEYKDSDAVSGYRRYYLGAKVATATWKNRPMPSLGEAIMAKAKPAAPAHPVFEKAAEEATAKRNRTSPNFPPEAAVTFLTDKNPKREGSKSYERFEAYMGTTTVGEYIAAGGTYGDLKYDAEHGMISVEGFDAVVKERKVRETKATNPEAAEKPAKVKRAKKAAPAPAPVEADEESVEE